MLGIKHCKCAIRLMVHHQQIPVRVPHLAVLEIRLLGLRQLPAGTVPHGALHLVGRFFLTIVITLAYTIYRRLSIALSASGGLGIVGM